MIAQRHGRLLSPCCNRQRKTAQGWSGGGSVSVCSKPQTNHKGRQHRETEEANRKASRSTLDGEPIASNAASDLHIERSPLPLQIGNWVRNNRAFNGQIKEVRIFFETSVGGQRDRRNRWEHLKEGAVPPKNECLPIGRIAAKLRGRQVHTKRRLRNALKQIAVCGGQRRSSTPTKRPSSTMRPAVKKRPFAAQIRASDSAIFASLLS